MAMAAAAMIAVVAQPSVNVSGATVKRPIWSRRLPTHIMAAIQRSDDTSGPETLGEANAHFQKKCDA